MKGSNEILRVISHFLSTITILLCFLLKLPQIHRLYQKKSIIGLNFYSLLFELSGYSITTCYNYVNGYSLISYLEYPVIIVQEWILIFLYFKYSSKLNTKHLLLIALYVAGAVIFCSNVKPSLTLEYLLIICTPASLSSKAIQLLEIWKIRSADSLSLTTWCLSAFTNFTRIYTIALDSADPVLLTNFTLSGSSSLAILLSGYYLQKQKLQ